LLALLEANIADGGSGEFEDLFRAI